jgi:outer membrane protein assembly factor BamB
MTVFSEQQGKEKNMTIRRNTSLLLLAAFILSILLFFGCSRLDYQSRIIQEIGTTPGICAIIGDKSCELSIPLALITDLTIYVQLSDKNEVEMARRSADKANMYGTRIFVEQGDYQKIHLADNLVDILVVIDKELSFSQEEMLRVVRPQGIVLIGNRKFKKDFPEGIDDWSHPYHGPDNNPQSEDQLAQAPYLTQFLAEPHYAPLTQVAVASAGRVFKAFGNLAFHQREEAYLNTLVAFNGYNGTILWKRKLKPGLMIHRSTMIATPGILYLGDDLSCKLINAASGELEDEIAPPAEIAGGTFWKWMALEGDVLYALLGEQEHNTQVIRQRTQRHGWPWYPLARGFNEKTHPWGFGSHLLAIHIKNKKIIWSHIEDEPIDSRALCMKNGRIYIHRFGSYLACLDTKTGAVLWRKTPENSPELFESLGTYLNRQDWRTNWRTTAYLKCSDKALYFAGPAIDKLLAVSTEDGSVMWENSYNNFQLVLRDDGLYAISGQIDNHKSFKFDPLSGEILAEFETRRRACTRPNGAKDAIFYRASGGSVRLDLISEQQQWISPMRAQCQDGVTIANGLLYWWPNVCDCQNTIYGFTCLGPAGDFDFYKPATEAGRLEVENVNINNIESLSETVYSWPTFRADNTCTATSGAVVSPATESLWWYEPGRNFTPTPPVTVGNLVFIGGSDGIVRALDAATGVEKWKTYTGGLIRGAPTVWKSRMFVGSGDGWVYSLEAQTGKLLWRFRAAPEERKIPVYGKLLSTWPVASGIKIADGIAYFAAGIVNYDGTYVYALDALTGKIIWQNNSSGHLDRQARCGASVQGHMLINNNKLYLASGTSFSPAVYDIKNGKCLNDPDPLKLCASSAPRGWELFTVGDSVVVGGQPYYGDPEYPVYDPSVSNKIFHTTTGDRDVVWLDNRLIRCYTNINKDLLNRCVSDPKTKTFYMNQGWGKFVVPHTPLWEYKCDNSVAIAVCQNGVVIANKLASDGIPAIDILDLQNGKPLLNSDGRSMRQRLICPPVPWGVAIDEKGRIIVALEDGQIMCYGEN